MKYGQALTFIINEKDWLKKMAIATAFSLLIPVCVGIFPLMGWSVGITRRIIQNADQKLPDWSNLGKILGDGIKGVAMVVVWFLPSLILVLLAGNVPFHLAGSKNFLPLNDELVVWLNIILIIYSLFAGIMTIAGLGVLADTGSFREAVTPSVVIRCFSTRAKRYIVLFFASIFLCLFFTLFGASLCLIGSFPVWAYIFTVLAHLYGQAYL